MKLYQAKVPFLYIYNGFLIFPCIFKKIVLSLPQIHHYRPIKTKSVL